MMTKVLEKEKQSFWGNLPTLVCGSELQTQSPQIRWLLLIGIIMCLAVLALGIILRFYHITDNDFIFYDEGYYLNWSRPLGEMIAHHQFMGAGDRLEAIKYFFSRSLASGKTLWFLLVDSRYFFNGLELWSVSRLWAAILGMATLGMTFLFSRTYFKNNLTAGLAAAILALLPSHVFYSRIGMQESLSTLLCLCGFYFYTFPTSLNFRSLIAGGFWALAYFSNYRLIMLPILITVWECGLSISFRRKVNYRKWLWTLLTFAVFVVGIGSQFGGENLYVIFAWVYHQAGMAHSQTSFGNIFLYPFYLFRLETAVFAALFFGNLFFIRNRDKSEILLVLMVIIQMAIFTMASEKGARYLCVMFPFAAMAVAGLLTYLWRKSADVFGRMALIGIVVVLFTAMGIKSCQLAKSHSDYQSSIKDILGRDPQARILSTQNYIQNLYVPSGEQVAETPHGLNSLLIKYQQGYKYLIVCPQSYISMTEDQNHFTHPLRGYLGFIVTHFQPLKFYPNFNEVLLERFVCEQSENLWRSISFLNSAQATQAGALRVYDLRVVVPAMLKVIAHTQSQEKR